MDSLNIDNRSKTLAFKKFKHLPYKYYPKKVLIFDIRHKVLQVLIMLEF